VRPYLLSGGLALIWFAQFQDMRVDGDAPAWGIAAVMAIRLVADFVAAWLVVSLLRLAVAAGRLGWLRLRASRQ
jgi:hypothetical protein